MTGSTGPARSRNIVRRVAAGMVAILGTAALVLGGATAAHADPVTGPANAKGARTTVDPGLGVPTTNGAVAVSGSGFVKGSNPHGAYVLFGYVTKFPSKGGSLGNGYDYFPGEDNQRFIAWPGAATAGSANALFAAGGAFSVTGLVVDPTFTGQSGKQVNCLNGSVVCGVFTIGAHGMSDANMETFTLLRFEGQSRFPDVPKSSPFHAAIDWAVNNGITNGYSDGTFRPVAPISRDAVAAMLFRAENPGASKPVCGPGQTPFTDVGPSHPFCGEIAWMKAEGISTGNTNGTFTPASQVSRQAVAAFLARAWEDDPLPVCDATLFTDVGASNPFCEEITWMKQQGISNGWQVGSGSQFRPGANIERQAFVTFLYRHYAAT